MSTGESGGSGGGTPAKQVSRPKSAGEAFGLERSLHWYDGFSIALGVPVLLVFSVGDTVASAGTLAPFIWIVSVSIGFMQAFVFAEMAGLFPHKSGGHSLYGSEAWRRRNRFVPPVDVWGNWFAWSPVLAISALLVGGYVQEQWIPGADFSWDAEPFHITLATFIGAATLVGVFWLNHFSIKSSARIQQVLGVFSIIPLALLLIVPLLEGKVDTNNLTPIQPLDGNWGSWATLEVIAAGLFVAAWSAYAFETTIAYTSEYRNPGKDAPRAILGAGVINFVFYALGPLVLLGVVGQEQIAQGPSVAFVPLAKETFGAGADIAIALLIVSLILIINTAILGSARTLFQASIEGYTFRALSKVNKRKVPARAMGFDVIVNFLLMSLGTPIGILAASTVGYMITNFVDLSAGVMLRRDTEGMKVSFRAPTAFVKMAVFFAALNMTLLFIGGPTWGWGAMALGWGIVLLAIPFYFWRRRADDEMGIVEGTESSAITDDVPDVEPDAAGTPEQILAFADQLERRLDERTPGVSFWPILGTWLFGGVLLMIGFALSGVLTGIFYISGFLVILFSFLGFLFPRGRAGWWSL